MGVPLVIIHFNAVFPYKPSSYWGTPICGTPPYVSRCFFPLQERQLGAQVWTCYRKFCRWLRGEASPYGIVAIWVGMMISNRAPFSDKACFLWTDLDLGYSTGSDMDGLFIFTFFFLRIYLAWTTRLLAYIRLAMYTERITFSGALAIQDRPNR